MVISQSPVIIEMPHFVSPRTAVHFEELYATLENPNEPWPLRCRIWYLGGLLLALRSFITLQRIHTSQWPLRWPYSVSRRTTVSFEGLSAALVKSKWNMTIEMPQAVSQQTIISIEGLYNVLEDLHGPLTTEMPRFVYLSGLPLALKSFMPLW